jgi:dTDP-4-dehydrorhamnose reductase
MHRSLLDWFLLNTDKRVSGYRKSIYSGVTTNHLAEVVERVIRDHPELNGLYQVASEPITKYDLLIMLREAFGCDVEIDPVDGEQVNRSMNGTKLFKAIGYICPPWQTLVRQLADDCTPYDMWLKGQTRGRENGTGVSV